MVFHSVVEKKKLRGLAFELIELNESREVLCQQIGLLSRQSVRLHVSAFQALLVLGSAMKTVFAVHWQDIVAGCVFFAATLLGGRVSADWPMWGGSPSRNNVVSDLVPTEWNVGVIDRQTGKWDPEQARNIKWVARLGSQTYGNPVVAGGRIFVGTNNGAGYVKRYPDNVDVSCLLCFRTADGEFLWQYTAEKLPTGRVHDWPMQGICSAPLVQGDRMWLVDNRGCIVCLDTEGHYDGEDDGPVKGEERRLFAVVPGVPAGKSDSHLSLYTESVAISHLFRAHGVNVGYSQVRSEIPNRRWVVTARGKTPKVYFLELDGYELRAYAEDDNTSPVFTANRNELRWLDENKMSPQIRSAFLQSDEVLPEEVVVKTTAQNAVWNITAIRGGVETSYCLRLEGFWLSAYKTITPRDKDEADVVWRLDMMNQLGVSQHNMATCAPAAWGDLLFICTSNGLDETHIRLPAPDAPSFIAVDKKTGHLLWSDKSPGNNILHGQWSAPAIAELGGVPQVIFPGGDGWIYSFHAEIWNEEEGTPVLLWKFDANPKRSKWVLGGGGTRNNVIAIPVIYDGLVYIGVGQDPEHGEGEGHLWCIDPTRRGDVSPELAMKLVDHVLTPIPHRRVQAVISEERETAIANPNSAVVWHYDRFDQDEDGEVDFEEEMHRTISSPAIKDDLLFTVDFSGLVHCLDAKTGRVNWTCDLLAQCWSSPLIAGQHVYIGDEDGDVAVFALSKARQLSVRRTRHVHRGRVLFSLEPRHENRLNSSVYTTPIAADGVLYIADKSHLFAIQESPE